MQPSTFLAAVAAGSAALVAATPITSSSNSNGNLQERDHFLFPFLGDGGRLTAPPIVHTGSDADADAGASADGAKVAMYWGQNKTQNSLTSYCANDSGVDIILLAFLHGWGNGQWSGVFGVGCEIVNGTIGDGCADLGKELATCNANGKDVYLSVGGNAGNQNLNDDADAEKVADALWLQFANPAHISPSPTPPGPRPFGNAYITGYDFNYEQSNPSTIAHFPALIKTLRSHIASKPYKLSAAPMCAIPSPTMGSILASAQFDLVWPQFYNGPGAAWYYTHGGTSSSPQRRNFNYAAWARELARGESKSARLWLGLPGGPYGATMNEDGPNQWLPPAELAMLVRDVKSGAVGDGQGGAEGGKFGGVMLYDAAQSQAASTEEGMGGKTYAQIATCVVRTGKVC